VWKVVCVVMVTTQRDSVPSVGWLHVGGLCVVLSHEQCCYRLAAKSLTAMRMAICGEADMALVKERQRPSGGVGFFEHVLAACDCMYAAQHTYICTCMYVYPVGCAQRNVKPERGGHWVGTCAVRIRCQRALFVGLLLVQHGRQLAALHPCFMSSFAVVGHGRSQAVSPCSAYSGL
jgi:hypothetical protein